MKIQHPTDKWASISFSGEGLIPNADGIIDAPDDSEFLAIAFSHGFELVDGTPQTPSDADKTLTVGQIKASINAETDLDALEAAEVAGGNRKGVLDAINVERNRRAGV